MTDLIGRTIGQYQIIEKIGKGGMADVYKAYQPGLDRYVAIKILPEYFLRDETFLARFQREAKAIAKLSHPHILPVYDFGQYDDLTYIVMQYVEAGTLQDMLGESLGFRRAVDIIDQVAEALDYAHEQGIIHRDVKPSNVLMERGKRALLTDFGLAKMTEASIQLTGSGVGVGTPAYMSPEQGQGKEVDARSDVYSLGVMLYEMLTGRVPYEAETPMAVVIKHITAPLPLPREVNPAISETVERVILKAIAKEPNDRYQSAEELAEALKKAAGVAEEALPVVVPEVREAEVESVVEEEAVPSWRNVPLWVWGAVGGGVLLVAVAGAFLAGRVSKPGPTPTVAAQATTPAATSTATPTEATQAISVIGEPTTMPSPISTPLPPTSTDTPLPPTPTRTLLPLTPTATPTAALTGKIAFTLWNGAKYDVWVANVDGSGRAMTVGNMRQPAFSPDGSKIAINGEAHYHDNLHVVDVNSRNLIEVSENLEDSRPSWSPDGYRIVFDSTRHGDKRSRIYIVDDVFKREGHVLRSAGGDTLGRDPFWLPDGRIVYRGCDYWAVGVNCGLYIVPPDGNAIPTRLTTDSNDMAPTAHDNKVAFMSIRDGNREIYSINTDGSDLKRLTNNGVNDGLPTFSPDGQFIAFVSDEGGKWAIWAMKADGSGRHKLFDLNGGYGSGAKYDWTTERISWAP